MKLQEAIAYWESFQREIDELYPEVGKSGKATLDEQREPGALALAALRAQQEQGWISVNDRLPEPPKGDAR